MPEETKPAAAEEVQPQIQEVVINDELINNKLNILAGMIAELQTDVKDLKKKL